MSAFMGVVFLIAAIIMVPRLLSLIAALLLWSVVIAMAVLVAAPIMTVVVGISSL